LLCAALAVLQDCAAALQDCATFGNAPAGYWEKGGTGASANAAALAYLEAARAVPWLRTYLDLGCKAEAHGASYEAAHGVIGEKRT
jgi:hypothetical protein